METTAEDFLKEFGQGVNMINEAIKKYNLNPKNIVIYPLDGELKFSINNADLKAMAPQITN